MAKSYKYVALLRAVNVGKRQVKMEDLRKLFESYGFTDVSTYIQTGNVIFTAKQADSDKLARELEKKLSRSLGFEVAVFVLSRKQLQSAATTNPFEPERLDSKQRCHLLFLDRAPGADQRKAVMELQGKEYRFAVKGKVMYYAYDRQFDGNRRRNLDLEGALGATGTARTWKVVDKLIELAKD